MIQDHKDITIVTCPDGDWVALYTNGYKRLEGHSIQLTDVLDLLGIPYAEHEIEVPSGVDGDVDFTPKLADVGFSPYELDDEEPKYD